jgi:hypothetical protein
MLGHHSIRRPFLLGLAFSVEAEQNPRKYGYRTPYAYYDQVMESYAAWLLTLNNQEDVREVDLIVKK